MVKAVLALALSALAVSPALGAPASPPKPEPSAPTAITDPPPPSETLVTTVIDPIPPPDSLITTVIDPIPPPSTESASWTVIDPLPLPSSLVSTLIDPIPPPSTETASWTVIDPLPLPSSLVSTLIDPIPPPPTGSPSRNSTPVATLPVPPSPVATQPIVTPPIASSDLAAIPSIPLERPNPDNESIPQPGESWYTLHPNGVKDKCLIVSKPGYRAPVTIGDCSAGEFRWGVKHQNLGPGNGTTIRLVGTGWCLAAGVDFDGEGKFAPASGMPVYLDYCLGVRICIKLPNSNGCAPIGEGTEWRRHMFNLNGATSNRLKLISPQHTKGRKHAPKEFCLDNKDRNFTEAQIWSCHGEDYTEFAQNQVWDWSPIFSIQN